MEKYVICREDGKALWISQDLTVIDREEEAGRFKEIIEKDALLVELKETVPDWAESWFTEDALLKHYEEQFS